MEYIGLIIGAVITALFATLFFFLTRRENRRYKDIKALNIDSNLGEHELLEILNRKVKSDKNDSFSLMLIDIDQYEEIRSELMPEEETFLLELIKNNIKRFITDEVVIATTNKVDKYLLYLPKGYDYSRVLKVADNIKKQLGRKIEVYGKNPILLKTSIAIVNYPNHGNSASLVKEALDLNMFEIKKAGGNQIRYYSVEVNQNYESFQLSLELKSAIKNKEFIYYYQPIVKINNGDSKIIGFESLIRWEHKTKGILTPGSFISLLESSGDLEKLGLEGLESGVMLVRQLNVLTNENYSININLSPRQILLDKNIMFFQRLVNKHRVKPEQVIIELPDFSSYASNTDLLRNTVKLISVGFKIAIDVKTTDYNILNEIPNYPINIIKISSRIIKSEDAVNYKNFISSLSELANRQGIELLCESVETKEEQDFFEKQGIKLMQGYKYYEPMSEKALIDLLNGIKNEINNE